MGKILYNEISNFINLLLTVFVVNGLNPVFVSYSVVVPPLLPSPSLILVDFSLSTDLSIYLLFPGVPFIFPEPSLLLPVISFFFKLQLFLLTLMLFLTQQFLFFGL